MFDFTEILELRGVDPQSARLVRNDMRGLAEWRRGEEYWFHFISAHPNDRRHPAQGAATVFQFVPDAVLPDGDATALFIGAQDEIDIWTIGNPPRLPAMHSPRSIYERSSTDLAYELRPRPDIEDLCERIVIRWGKGVRAWSQWAHTQRKEIVEIRRSADEPPFPGFAAFASSVEEVPILPVTWRSALESVKGVYLLVCPNTGEQYVGSAYGDTGFLGRWLNYAADGHGQNKLLMARERVNYAVTILEIASPDMSPSEIIGREGAWKTKLGSRAHGLNAN